MNAPVHMTVSGHLHGDTVLRVESYGRGASGRAFVALNVGDGSSAIALLTHDLEALANLAEAVENASVELARALGETDTPCGYDPRQGVLPSAV